MTLPDVLLSVFMGLGLAAACGFRVFIPLLVTGLAYRFDVLPASGMPWLGNTWVLLSLLIASCLEVAAYKIPFLDNLLDVLGAPMALGAGALMTSKFFIHDGNDGFVTILSIIAGAGSAGIIHGATAATRLASTKTTLGTANPILGIVEAIASFFSALMAIFLPLVMGIATLLALCFAVSFLLKRRRRINAVSSFER